MMKDKIRIYYVDDQLNEIENFKNLISQTTEFELVGCANSAVQAISDIKELQPEILFTDIEMGEYDGFWVAEELKELPICIVFLTSFTDKALNAFKISALQYIVKPCSLVDLQLVLHDYLEVYKHNIAMQKEQLNALAFNYQNPNLIPKRIFVNNIEKTTVISIQDLIYAKSKGSYTHFKLTDGTEVLSSKNIKIYNDILNTHPDIVRVHRAVLVNKNCVKSIRRDKHLAFVQLKNGEEVEISLYRKDEVIQQLMS
jgi:two-component system, LytTR family, response regulator